MNVRDFPEVDPITLAAELRRQHESAAVHERLWMEEVIDLPFSGLPTQVGLESILLGAQGIRCEMLLDIAFEGLAGAFAIWSEVAAMEDAYTGTDRTEAMIGGMVREEVA